VSTQHIEKNDLINIILKRISEFADLLINECRRYCEDYVKRSRDKSEYALEYCLWRAKNYARSELFEFLRKLLKLCGDIELTEEDRKTLNKKIQEIVDNTLNTIYPHEIYPIF
jgi:uncharacterized membrane protein YgaE (UPF0421/DUF939 family)